MTETDAALYETPFSHALTHVKAHRKDAKWWLHERPRPELRKAIKEHLRFIVTPQTAKYRLFYWLPKGVLPDQQLELAEQWIIRDALHGRGLTGKTASN